jgi:hypothetical protein
MQPMQIQIFSQPSPRKSELSVSRKWFNDRIQVEAEMMELNSYSSDPYVLNLPHYVLVNFAGRLLEAHGHATL